MPWPTRIAVRRLVAPLRTWMIETQRAMSESSASDDDRHAAESWQVFPVDSIDIGTPIARPHLAEGERPGTARPS